MTSIESLVRQYPDLTGKELLLIQEKEMEADKIHFNKLYKSKLEYINDLNENGGYFKSTYGKNQYRYDWFTNLTLNKNGNIHCDVETIVGFNDNLTIKRKKNINAELREYLPQDRDRITKAEYDKLSTHLDDIFVEFWGLIDQSKF